MIQILTFLKFLGDGLNFLSDTQQSPYKLVFSYTAQHCPLGSFINSNLPTFLFILNPNSNT
jgi:hypothetical protein